MRKSKLARKYNLADTQLRYLLNSLYYKELKAVGYAKSDKVLSPKVVRRFIELYGPPINENDYEE